MEEKFKKILCNANKAISNLKDKEDIMSSFFQPYFDDEIFVMYQESDGFVVVHNVDHKDKNHSTLNSSVNEVFYNIKKDKNFYKK